MSRWYFVLSLAGMALPAMGQSPAPASSHRVQSALTIKTGELWLADVSQTFAGADWSFEPAAVNVLTIEGETRLPKAAENFSIGGEFLYSQHFFKRTSGTPPDQGKIETRALLAKSKYYFRRGEAFQPYAGLGLGVVDAQDYSGPVRNPASGTGYLGVVGVLMRAERVGLRAEYVGLRARLTDADGQKVNLSSHGILVGISFFLGRR